MVSSGTEVVLFGDEGGVVIQPFLLLGVRGRHVFSDCPYLYSGSQVCWMIVGCRGLASTFGLDRRKWVSRVILLEHHGCLQDVTMYGLTTILLDE